MSSRLELAAAYLARRDDSIDIQPALKDACRRTAEALIQRFKGERK